MTRGAVLLALTLAGCATAAAPTEVVVRPIAAQAEPSASIARPAAAPGAPSPATDEGERPASDLFESGPKCYRACLYLCHGSESDCGRTCSIECSEF
jgi:hypothetical protein